MFSDIRFVRFVEQGCNLTNLHQLLRHNVLHKIVTLTVYVLHWFGNCQSSIVRIIELTPVVKRINGDVNVEDFEFYDWQDKEIL